MKLFEVTHKMAWDHNPVYVVAKDFGEAEEKAIAAQDAPEEAAQDVEVESIQLLGPAECLVT